MPLGCGARQAVTPTGVLAAANARDAVVVLDHSVPDGGASADDGARPPANVVHADRLERSRVGAHVASLSLPSLLSCVRSSQIVLASTLKPDPPLVRSSVLYAGASVDDGPFEQFALHPLLVAQLQSLRPEGDEPDVPRRDWFASPAAAQARCFCTPQEDAWSLVWHGWLAWVFAPFRQLNAVSAKLSAERCAGTVIAPVVPSASWFNHFVRVSAVVAFIAPDPLNLVPVSQSAAATHRQDWVAPLVAFVSDDFGAAARSTSVLHIGLPARTAQLFRLPRCPFVLSEWELRLSSHPDRALVSRVLRGIVFGRSLGYSGQRLEHRVTDNLKSERTYATQLAAAREKEYRSGWRCGPFVAMPLFNLITSPTGGVLHRFKNKVRPIIDLSYPHLRNGDPGPDSVNGQIAAVHVSYASLDEMCARLVESGPGALLFSFDVVSAYKQVPVRCEDWHLQGARGSDGSFSFSTVLEFGGRSSVSIWDEYGGAFEFMLRTDAQLLSSIDALQRYVDDLLAIVYSAGRRSGVTPGGPDYGRALAAKARICELARQLGMPIDKLQGPATSITYLGVNVDSAAMTLAIAPERLAYMRAHLGRWVHLRWCRRHELQSLIGLLEFLCRVVRPGRAFVQVAYRVMCSVHHDRGHVRLSAAFRHDMRWWLACLEEWSGSSIIREHQLSVGAFEGALHVFTDACEVGQGGFFSGQWFSLEWSADQLAHAARSVRLAMPFLELFAILSACSAWGPQWRGRLVVVHTDCEPAQAAVQRHHSDVSESQALVRAIAMCEVRFDFTLAAVHVRGVDNVLADALSRLDVQRFRSACSSASRSPTPVPPPGFLNFE